MRIASELLPPVAYRALKTAFRAIAPRKTKLFDGSSAMFERVTAQATNYGEYGVGASTEWVYANTNAKIYAVETSPEWARKITADKDLERLQLELVDLGPVGDWGRPRDYSRRDRFSAYRDSIWRRDGKPDLVLIDGRFRVACFLTSLNCADPGTNIIFDDYSDRPFYHVIEEILKPVEFCGRQARFEVANGIDRGKVAQLLSRFEYVMD